MQVDVLQCGKQHRIALAVAGPVESRDAPGKDAELLVLPSFPQLVDFLKHVSSVGTGALARVPQLG